MITHAAVYQDDGCRSSMESVTGMVVDADPNGIVVRRTSLAVCLYNLLSTASSRRTSPKAAPCSLISHENGTRVKRLLRRLLLRTIETSLPRCDVVRTIHLPIWRTYIDPPTFLYFFVFFITIVLPKFTTSRVRFIIAIFILTLVFILCLIIHII